MTGARPWTSDTALLQDQPCLDATPVKWIGQSPLNRVASPSEVADAVVYLASRQAQLASGSILDLNGASYLRM